MGARGNERPPIIREEHSKVGARGNESGEMRDPRVIAERPSSIREGHSKVGARGNERPPSNSREAPEYKRRT